MVPEQVLKSRRQFLAIATTGSLSIFGCKPSTEPTEVAVTSTPRRDVPLRVLLAGTDAWADALKTAWSGIAEQPLQITVLDAAKISAKDWQTSVLDSLLRSDVAIVPCGLLPAIESASGLTPPTDDLLGGEGIDSTLFYAMLREGLMKYGGRTTSVPLGGIQPALALNLLALDGQAITPPPDWDSYIELAKQWNAKASDKSTEPCVAEPLAGGAAAKMFLWRASSAEPEVWLFERETFKPVIDGPEYVNALETMKRCVDQYHGARLTAGEVWSLLASGKLKMAIGWPAISAGAERIEEVTDCEFLPMPQVDSKNENAQQTVAPVPTLLDVDSPVAILSSHCRQSDSAKRFLKWVVGGEGTGMIKNAVTGLTDLRGSHSSETGNALASVAEDATGDRGKGGDYSAVLSTALSSLRIQTPLQLLEYRRYMQSLDNAVLRCLDGKQTASEALAEAAADWNAITNEIGMKPQLQSWRRAQGLRS